MKKIAIKRKKFLDSKEHQKFVKREKTKTFLVHFSRIFLLVAIIGLWQLVAFKNWVDPFIISSPSRIIKQLKILFDSGSLTLHLTTTLTETIYAFLLSTVIGFVIAVILYSMTFTRRVFEPYLVILNSLPKIALGPLIII
jgi:NitT/TauT family transport system permease protein